MPYLPKVGGDHHRKGIWFRWMGVFLCPVRPCSFPHPLPSPPCIFYPSHHLLLPLHPPHLEASRPMPKPWDHVFMPGWHYLSVLSTLVHIPACSLSSVANTDPCSVCISFTTTWCSCHCSCNMTLFVNYQYNTHMHKNLPALRSLFTRSGNMWFNNRRV